MNTASSLSIILPVFCGVLALKYLNKELRLLFTLCILALITEWVSYKTELLLPANIEFLYYTTWIGIETVFLFFIFYSWSNRRIYKYVGFTFLAIYIPYIVLVGGIYSYEPYSRIASSLIITAAVVILLGKAIKTKSYVMLVILTGLFFYFLGNLPIWYIYYLSSFTQEQKNTIWALHAPTNIFMNLSFATAFILQKILIVRSKEGRIVKAADPVNPKNAYTDFDVS